MKNELCIFVNFSLRSEIGGSGRAIAADWRCDQTHRFHYYFYHYRISHREPAIHSEQWALGTGQTDTKRLTTIYNFSSVSPFMFFHVPILARAVCLYHFHSSHGRRRAHNHNNIIIIIAAAASDVEKSTKCLAHGRGNIVGG